MLNVGWQSLWATANSILFLGAHSDDIEIGCGATVLSLLERRPDLHISWVVFSAEGRRADEARESAARFLDASSNTDVVVKDYRERYFPYRGEAIKEYFDELGRTLNPDVVFTHRSIDAHQDHRIVGELTSNTFRDQIILEYEIPKFDADLGQPNTFFPATRRLAQLKTDIIMETFASQVDRHWFDEETLRSMMRIRGVESKAESGYAEAFHCRKLVLG